MRKIIKQNDKATVCANNKCLTVYGEAARIVNTIAIITALVIGIALLAKSVD
jgi:hypothetical protein